MTAPTGTFPIPPRRGVAKRRADKSQREFAIDNSAFIRDLRARDFVVADDSRSNETITELTLAQLFTYRGAGDSLRARRANRRGAPAARPHALH